MSIFKRVAGALGVAGLVFLSSAPAGAFVTFESGPVRPLAKSPDGTRLFVCNIPDNTLEVFDIEPDGLTKVASVPVGLEPVAVAARTDTEVWVVNFLSDSVSIVDLTDIDAPRVTRTLTVGDEPRDIVFGGALFNKAFITTAHRGQNDPNDPQLTTEGVGRADVWVFDATALGSDFGGNETTILTLFGDTPRPLAVSPDGTRVYAGVFLSGNQTTVINEGVIPNALDFNGNPVPSRPALALPPPDTDASGDPRPEVGLIVKFDGTHWVDELGRNFDSLVRLSLPDYDVFAIDATQNPPAQVAGSGGQFAHVGTTLFNMSINPADGKLFVSNLEAFNDVRFEGPGTFADTTVRGHLVESRITVIDPLAETVTPVHLNKHITYDDTFDPIPNTTNDKSLAFPLDMAFTADGSKLYVAAFGSSKIGTYVTSELAGDTFTPDAADQIQVSGGGPAGIVLDEATSRLFVLTRFNNSVSIVDTAINTELENIPLHNPEPASVVAGRPFLYDARHTSARGDQACASCHIFGDMDGLAWDLGNPDDDIVNNPQQFTIGPIGDPDFHPMKGPMTTQSLRGMDNHGPMHWRGDRTGGNTEANHQPNQGSYNEDLAFKAFNPAFVGLIGRSATLPDIEMQAYTDFILQVMYPPNPIRALDNSLTPGQAVAQNIFFNRDPIDTFETCESCHRTNRNGNAGVARPGFFGTDGQSSFENETQHFKIAHLRNLYQKVGMFGNAAEPFVNPGNNGNLGDQVRGFGFLHDGSIDTVFRFLQATVFNPHAAGPGNNPPANIGFLNDTERADMESFVLAFDSNHRPVVGQQVTLTSTTGGDADTRVDLLLDRADANECDVVVKGVIAGEERGWVYDGSGQFSTDSFGDGQVAEAALRALADTAGQELTFTAVPVGEGYRIGLDRDLDGYRNADEVGAGSDPGDEASTPCATTTSNFVYTKAKLQDSKGKLQIKADMTLSSAYTGGVVSVVAMDGGGIIFTGEIGALTPNNAATKYTYKAPMDSTGITKVAVKAMKDPGVYRVTMKTSAAWTPPSADETIVSTFVTLRVVDECVDGPATKVDD